MSVHHTLFRCALLGSALAVVAFTSAAGAAQSRADWKRTMAVTGGHASAAQNAAATRPVAPHAGSTYTVLHNFSGPPNDGDYPTAEPTLDTSGNIYGVTDYGGANSAGALFEITSGGTESVIHSFGAAGDGTYPDGAVIFDANGNMYGTTEDGGASDNGTVWELAADGTYSVLHSFASTEGNFIRGRLVQDKQGNLYGTALFGGANGDGSVFECSTSGKLTVLYSFGGTDGQYPEHGVVVDKKGNLYGATAFGGANDDGSVYKISRKGSFTSLYSFTGGSDGSFLYGGLAIGRKGKLYGSAASNGAGNNGTVFKMTPTGTLTTLYSFTGGSDGGSPEGDMLVVGKKLYSAANYGGADGYGVVYEVTPKGKETVLESFTNANGAAYSAGMTASGKTLYGTAGGGGTDGFGVVFSVTKK